MTQPTRRISPSDWNALVASFPQAHILQSWEWGQSKIQNGWQPYYLAWMPGARGLVCEPWSVTEAVPPANPSPGAWPEVRALAMILHRAIPLAGFAARLSILYAPRGPLLRDWSDSDLQQAVMAGLQTFARRQGAIFLKIDPDVRLGCGLPGAADERPDPGGAAVREALAGAGWLFSDEQVQFRNTVMVDLSPPEDEILARMKQKARYNIRLAQRKGVQVRSGGPADVGLLYRMYVETSVRDGFVIRDESYYRNLWGLFMANRPTSAAFGEPENAQTPLAEPLIAEVAGEAVAAMVIFRFAGKAWYMFGMSSETHREKMPNYLLQWEAMRRARAAGCQEYDLWGAPDEFNESDSMWGVWRFKEGLGGELVRHIGAWDFLANRVIYPLYTRLLPRLLDTMRRRARRKTAIKRVG